MSIDNTVTIEKRASFGNTMTIDDLRHILVACAGEVDEAQLNEGTVDTNLDDLGYDSLARMEAVATIAKEYGVRVTDDALWELRTPRDIIDLVNGAHPGA
jgi:minimal PKS acyl carrier protein